METLKRTLHSNQIHVSIHPEFHRRWLITTLKPLLFGNRQPAFPPQEEPTVQMKLRGESFITRRFLSLGGREKKLQVYLSIDDKR